MLSPCFDAGEDVVGLAPAQLQQAAQLIQSGGHYTFDPKAVEKVVALQAAARAITPRKLVVDLVRWLAPPLLLLGAMYWLVACS